MINKDQFIRRIKFLKDRERFLANRKRKKPITLEEIEVPVPILHNPKWTNK